MKVSVPSPVLVTVTFCGVLAVFTSTCPNDNDPGESVTAGEPLPVPVRLTACGLVGSPSVMVRLPVIVPTAFGVNVTEIMQLLPAARLVPQVLLLTAYCDVLVTTLVIASAVLPKFCRVTFCGALVVPVC